MSKDRNLEYLLWTQRVEKENKALKVCRNFRVHPDAVVIFPDKVNLRKPIWSELSVPEDRAEPPEGSAEALLPKLRERGPKDRSFLPQTTSQDIGWAVADTRSRRNSVSEIWPAQVPPSAAPTMVERERIGDPEAAAILARSKSLPPPPPRPKVPPSLERSKLSAPGGSLGPYRPPPGGTVITSKSRKTGAGSGSSKTWLPQPRTTWRHATAEEEKRDFGKELEDTRERLQQKYQLIEKQFIGRNQATYHGLGTSDVSRYATDFVMAFGYNPFSIKNGRG